MNQGFDEFKSKLNIFFEGDYPEELCVEVLFDVVEGTDKHYEFDHPHLRLTQDLLLAAVLLCEWKNLKVVFLTATSYYAAQAMRFVRGYQRFGHACSTLTVGVAGMIPQHILQEADIIMHHGRVYPLPHMMDVSKKRMIVQIFPNENVPHDTRTLGALYCASYD